MKKLHRIHLHVVYEDDFVLIADKDPDLLTVSTGKELNEDTLFHMASEHVKRKNKNAKVFIVNRLDRFTSGLVVFAKTYEMKEELQSYFESRTVVRKYEAVVDGVLKGSGTIKNFLIIDKMGNVFLTKKHPGAKDAITHYTAIKDDGQKTLVDISIETGRKNQIRIGFASIGHPVLGDMKYGKDAKLRWKKMALNAYYLQFPDDAPLAQKTFEITKCYTNSLNS